MATRRQVYSRSTDLPGLTPSQQPRRWSGRPPPSGRRAADSNDPNRRKRGHDSRRYQASDRGAVAPSSSRHRQHPLGERRWRTSFSGAARATELSRS